MGYKLEKIGKIVALLKLMEQYYKTKEHEKHIDKIFSDMTEAYKGLLKQLGITNVEEIANETGVVEERKDMESLFGGRTDEVISTILKDYEKRVAEEEKIFNISHALTVFKDEYLNKLQTKHYEAVNWLIGDKYPASGRTTLLAFCFLKQALETGKLVAVYDHQQRCSYEIIMNSIEHVASVFSDKVEIKRAKNSNTFSAHILED